MTHDPDLSHYSDDELRRIAAGWRGYMGAKMPNSADDPRVKSLNERLTADPKEYVDRMKQFTDHDDHVAADRLLCELLVKLGYREVVEAWEQVPKWYE